ncbi:MAG: proline--tRNA ligase [Nitrospirae bacterium]|nr:proline--tRNA ligase [Nitrospirota bacterium]
MRYSKLFIPTLREAPADAEAISHKLLVRAGFVRQLASGLYIYLPTGWRVLNRINRIMKEEMDAIGAQELSMPVLHPAEIWQETGRWSVIGDEMFRLKDRGGRDMCLGMTHEEIMTWLAAREIRSYRDLPQVWYQMQTKLRDEARPKSGILRTREFIMKDSYSFDRDEEGLDINYRSHSEAYHRIFARCGLKFHEVESDSGMMGGAVSHEFMAPSAAGEDTIAICACGYQSNVECAASTPKPAPVAAWEKEEIHTPNRRTVQEVSNFLKADASSFMKSIMVMATSPENSPVLAVVRGDQTLHEKKLAKIIGQFRAATKDEIRETLGVEAGFIGPMGHSVRIIADPCLKDGMFISGANKADYHMRGVQAGVDFTPEWADIHEAKPGDACSKCGAPLAFENVIEIGNIFKLGTKYSAALNAAYLDEQGNSHPIIMGSYGIGPARIMAAAVEQGSDKNGIVWPEAIAPFDVEIVPLNVGNPEAVEVADAVCAALEKAGLEVLIDDRDERPGVKLKDADLIGIPWIVVVGDKTLKDGMIEFKSRKTGEVAKLPVEGAGEAIAERMGKNV